MISLIDTSAASPVLLATKLARANLVGTAHVSAAKLDASTAYITWTGGGALGVDSMTARITDDDQIFLGALSEKLESAVTASSGYLACDALDSTHIMQVCRNAATYLSAKTIELSA